MSRKRTMSIVVLLMSTLTASPAHILRVPSEIATIQLGINAAVRGDTVVVYPGIYTENINFLGKSIVVTSRYFEFNDSSLIASTVIDGSSPVHPDTGSVVLFINHEDSSAVLQGFTITGGKGTKWLDEHGAGLYREGGGILSALSSPTIKNNVIANNAVVFGSGAISAGGGGIRAGDGNPHIINNIIMENTGRYGAGIVLNFTDAVLRNNIIIKNAGGQDDGGGAVWINHPGASSKIIENNTIAANTVAGGGIYIWFGSPTTMRNNIIWGNTSPQITNRTSTAPVVIFSDVQGGYPGLGNIDRDPSFSDPLYHLRDTSSCVDGGDSAAAFNDPESPSNPGKALWPSSGTLRSDIGAYGGHGRAAFSPSFPVTSVDNSTLGTFPKLFLLEQNYPNPFNPSTHIDYQLNIAGDVRVDVFDTVGRHVQNLVHAHQETGNYSVVWDASKFTSGTYFCRMSLLSANGRFLTATKSLTLLK